MTFSLNNFMSKQYRDWYDKKCEEEELTPEDYKCGGCGVCSACELYAERHPRSDKELGIAFWIFMLVGLAFVVAKLYGF
jgi:hypothetical protein